MIAQRFAHSFAFLIKYDVEFTSRRSPAVFVDVEIKQRVLYRCDGKETRPRMPRRVYDRKAAFEDIIIYFFKRKQIFPHLVYKFFSGDCGQECDIDGVSTVDINFAGGDDTRVVRQVVDVGKHGTVHLPEYPAKLKGRESTRERDDYLIFIYFVFQQLSIALVCKRRSDNADIIHALNSLVDVVGYHIELYGTFYFTHALDCLRVEYLLHLSLELGHLIKIHSMSLYREIRRHRVCTVATAKNCYSLV